ncbi:MAG: hypothetical protein Q9204_001091 [Flavoplaca sp. TL-2023a]
MPLIFCVTPQSGVVELLTVLCTSSSSGSSSSSSSTSSKKSTMSTITIVFANADPGASVVRHVNALLLTAGNRLLRLLIASQLQHGGATNTAFIGEARPSPKALVPVGDFPEGYIPF